MRRAGTALSYRPRWLRGVARTVLASYHRPPADRPRELAAFIDATIEGVSQGPQDAPPPRVRRWLVRKAAMGRMRWPVPELATLGELAAFLELLHGELEWLADARGLERTVDDERLRNYRYDWLPRTGSAARVIERPKRRLKAIHRRLLHELLDNIPAHPAAHGFTRGRSARTHAAAHVGRLVVLRMDLEDFFASVRARRVYGIFRTCGYPEDVAHTLTALTTNVVPAREWGALPRPREGARAIAAHHWLGRRLATPHLPQGAPTSPALAKLAVHGLDRRLAGLAASLGAVYTRYADDLTFSGSRVLLGGARTWITRIARDEGFAINDAKTAVMTRAERQHVCGIVVNDHPNVTRGDYDALKAILNNAARNGPRAENRAHVADFRAHLLGRITWIESLNPDRGAKLRRRFEDIAWVRDRYRAALPWPHACRDRGGASHDCRGTAPIEHPRQEARAGRWHRDRDGASGLGSRGRAGRRRAAAP